MAESVQERVILLCIDVSPVVIVLRVFTFDVVFFCEVGWFFSFMKADDWLLQKLDVFCMFRFDFVELQSKMHANSLHFDLLNIWCLGVDAFPNFQELLQNAETIFCCLYRSCWKIAAGSWGAQTRFWEVQTCLPEQIMNCLIRSSSQKSKQKTFFFEY